MSHYIPVCVKLGPRPAIYALTATVFISPFMPLFACLTSIGLISALICVPVTARYMAKTNVGATRGSAFMRRTQYALALGGALSGVAAEAALRCQYGDYNRLGHVFKEKPLPQAFAHPTRSENLATRYAYMVNSSPR